MKIRSVLPHDRMRAGTIDIVNDAGDVIFGPVAARGKADGQIAAAHGNPTRDPKHEDGDHPAGTYRVVHVERDKSPAHSFGPFFLLLDPTSGDALIAKTNDRKGLAIHGGDPVADGSLRATEGCLRVSNATVVSIAGLVQPELAAGRPVIYECADLTTG